MKPILFTIIFSVIFSLSVLAQNRNNHLREFLDTFQKVYESGTYDDLQALFPGDEQKQLVAYIQQLEIPRSQGITEVIQQNQDSAIVFLTTQAETSHPLLNTMIPSGLSGFYRLQKDQQGWHLTEKIPIDRNNRITRQNLDVEVLPGEKLKVRDTLTIDIADSLGFWMTLHNHADISNVQLNNTETDFFFESGIFRLNSRKTDHATLVITYAIDAKFLRSDENPNFENSYGLIRQNNWHPMFDYGSKNDIADFLLKVKIPANYHLTTSFAQVEQVDDTVRTIYARSPYRTSDVALVYDNAWEVEKHQYEGITIEIFTTPDFQPSRNTLLNQAKETYDLLASKFGPPPGDYLGVAQQRASPYSGWFARTNDIIISYGNGGDNLKAKPWPRAYLAHEVSHAWTVPSGPARLFLMEGWATYIETYFLQEAYGDSTVQLFWDKQREAYLEGDYEGKISLWNDATNSGVSYYKGSWVFKILKDLLGEDVFEDGLTKYIQNSITPEKDIHAFAKSMSVAASFEVWPILESWLKSTHIPEVKAYTQNGHLIIDQLNGVFHFPLEIQIKSDQETHMDTYLVTEKSNKYPLEVNYSDVTAITIDPNQQMLLKIKQENKSKNSTLKN